jgi:hypothetical protein
MSEMLSVARLARRADRSEPFVRKLVEAGILRPDSIQGRQKLFAVARLDELLTTMQKHYRWAK